MSDLLTTPELVREIAKEPPRRWRNKWQATGLCIVNGVRCAPGETILGKKIWPSKETAEQCAIDDERRHPSEMVIYRGAIPVDESGEPL